MICIRLNGDPSRVAIKEYGVHSEGLETAVLVVHGSPSRIAEYKRAVAAALASSAPEPVELKPTPCAGCPD